MLEIINHELIELIEGHQQNPFNYLCESDIKGKLFAKFFDAFTQKQYFIEIETGYYAEKYYRGKHIKTLPVKAEYPSVLLFDIAFIDKDKVLGFKEYKELYPSKAVRSDTF